MEYFFSIIIPVYNVSLYLRECLDSILAQIFNDWEAICVDDGSTDGSGAILDEYADREKRIKVIHQQNAGVSAARNVALGMAHGLYVVFVDADDVITREWLKVFHKVINDEGCDAVRGRFKYWHGDIKKEELNNNKWEILARYNTKQRVCEWGIGEAIENGYSVLNCIKREKIQDLKFPVGVRIMEDCIFSAYVMSCVESVVVIDYQGYLYRINEISAVHTNSFKQSRVLDFYDFFCALRKFGCDINSTLSKTIDLLFVKKVLVRCVFKHMVQISKHFNTSKTDLIKLNEIVKNMYTIGLYDLYALKWHERMALWLYIKTSSRLGLLLLWKLKAARYKFEKFIKRRG